MASFGRKSDAAVGGISRRNAAALVPIGDSAARGDNSKPAGFPGRCAKRPRLLAGLLLSAIDRAKTILAKLESDDTEVSLPAAAPQAKPKKKITVAPADDSQLSLL